MKRVEPVQPNFGIRIRKLRFDSNMSQQDLADLCEMSVDQIASIERGKSFAGKSTISMLAAAFGFGKDHRKLFDYAENEAFVAAGGMRWRAPRKSRVVGISNRKAAVVVVAGKREQTKR